MKLNRNLFTISPANKRNARVYQLTSKNKVRKREIAHNVSNHSNSDRVRSGHDGEAAIELVRWRREGGSSDTNAESRRV